MSVDMISRAKRFTVGAVTRSVPPVRNGRWLLALPAALFLIVLFALPVIAILGPSLVDAQGSISFANYVRVFDTPVYLQVLVNTFRISALVALVCVIVSYPVALFVASSRASATSLILVMIMVPFWTSQLVRVFAWMVIFGRQGVINDTLLRLGFTSEPADLLYNLSAVTVAMVHACIPIAVLSISSSMSNIDRNLERAALTLGASRSHAFWQVYFPRSFPGVASAYLVVFIICLGIFTHPALLGSPREMMMAQLIIFQVEDLLNWSFAGAIAVYLLASTIFAVVVFDLVFGVSPLSAAATAPDAAANRQTLWSRARRALGLSILAALAWICDIAERAIHLIVRCRRNAVQSTTVLPILSWIGILFAALPTFVLIPVSFTEASTLSWPPTGFSLRWYVQVIDSPEWREAALRSVVVALGTSILAVLIGVPAAVALDKGLGKMNRPYMILVLLPMIVPNIIVSLALYYFYARVGLVGSYLGLIFSHTIFALPYVIITVRTALRNVAPQLAAAALTLGASPLIAFREVTLPLVRVGIATSALFAFVISFDELAVTLFLTGGSSVTFPIKLWTESRAYFSPLLASASVLLLAFILLIIMTGTILQKRSKTSSKGK